jgi:hypothetical protein
MKCQKIKIEPRMCKLWSSKKVPCIFGWVVIPAILIDNVPLIACSTTNENLFLVNYWYCFSPTVWQGCQLENKHFDLNLKQIWQEIFMQKYKIKIRNKNLSPLHQFQNFLIYLAIFNIVGDHMPPPPSPTTTTNK